jgi:hypothetical protein
LKTRRLLSVLVVATPWKPLPSASLGDEKADGRVVVVVVVTTPAPGGAGAPGNPGASAFARLEQAPLAVPGHRVLVLLAQELLLDQHLERGGQRIAVAPLVAGDGVRDLAAAEEQLLLGVVLHQVLPVRARRPHQDQHRRDRGQQRDERVARLRAAAAHGAFFAR